MAVAFDCARGKQDGEQLEWGVLGEPVHHRGALPLACGDEVAVVRHVADLGLGDGLDDGGCWGGHGVSCGLSATSTVGVCARRAASPLWVAPRPGVGSLAAANESVGNLRRQSCMKGISPKPLFECQVDVQEKRRISKHVSEGGPRVI